MFEFVGQLDDLAFVFIVLECGDHIIAGVILVDGAPFESAIKLKLDEKRWNRSSRGVSSAMSR